MNSKIPPSLLAVLVVIGLSEPVIGETNNFLGTIDSRWSEAGNWSLNRLPTAGDAAFLGPGDVVTIETAITGGARVVIGHNGVASLTVQSGGSYFYTATTPVVDVGNNATGDGTLTVASGATFENGGNIRPGLNGSTATVNVSGDLIARRGLLIDPTGTASLNLMAGLLQVGWVNGLTSAETDLAFDMQKGLFVSKANTDGDLVDDLAALAAAGFITSSNGNFPGWGQATLGFTDYDDIY
ncbi:MAG: hypothetical protein AAGA58_17240 [Verrucomicrobiota bacterium]